MPQPQTILGIPINRVVAFLGPYIATLAGIVATWLTVHVHLLATFHIGENDIVNGITQAVVFAVTAGITYAGQHKWLDGFQKWEQGLLVPPRIAPDEGDAGRP